MSRNLDLTSLRAFATVAEAGGVTRAAGILNLTQSAVSMQVKRLEESLGQALFDRSGRRLVLSAQGEELLAYARRMLVLNDEIWQRLSTAGTAETVVLGVPHDLVYPAIPQVLQRLATEFPRARVQLVSSFTLPLKTAFSRGEAHVILTTEDSAMPGSQTLAVRPLAWVGAPGGRAWRARPLRLAFESSCIFRAGIQKRLEEAGLPWEMAVDTASTRTIEATVSADLAVHAMIAGTEPAQFERVAHGGALPALWDVFVNLYRQPGAETALVSALVHHLRQVFPARI